MEKYNYIPAIVWFIAAGFNIGMGTTCALDNGSHVATGYCFGFATTAIGMGWVYLASYLRSKQGTKGEG